MSSPSLSPSLMPSPSPTALPSIVPTPLPTQVPDTPIPSSSPSLMPSPSPSVVPSVLPTPSPSLPPTLSPTLAPTANPTVTCTCLSVVDPQNNLTDYVGTYRYQSNNSPNTDKWMWERSGRGRNELIYYSQFGNVAARWVIKGSVYGEWAETSAQPSEAKPPQSASWMVNDNEGNFYQSLTVSCSQCEVTPPPTPDPSESPTQYPTSLSPTAAPTLSPTPKFCVVMSITDLTNGFYSGDFELDVLMYNDRPQWTDKRTGEKLIWADSAIFDNEGTVEHIWMIGFKSEEGEQDSHFLIRTEFSVDEYPPIGETELWKEYTFNEYSNQTSEVVIECHETEIPTTSPTLSPTDPLCAELYVKTCCDPVYSLLDGKYRAVTHRGGKNMYSNTENNYDIYYTLGKSGDFWSIRSEDNTLYWVMSSEDNGPYPSWHSVWNIQYQFSTDLGVDITINCSESFSPTKFPSPVPTHMPTSEGETLNPSKQDHEQLLRGPLPQGV